MEHKIENEFSIEPWFSKTIMEHKIENEFTIEPWFSKTIAHSHHGKFGLNFLKTIFDDITFGSLGDMAVDDLFFGSIVEGSISVGNLFRTLNNLQKYLTLLHDEL